MPYLVDGQFSVADVRGQGYEDEIAEVTGLAAATVRAKLRDAHGRTKLRNLFWQWPERADEIGRWTVAFAKEREAYDEIADIVTLSVDAVRRRLAEARGNMLVQNLFERWPSINRASDRESHPDAMAAGPDDPTSSVAAAGPEIETDVPEVGPPSPMFRRYDLRAARATRARRHPAAHQVAALTRLQHWYRSRPSGHRGGVLALPTGAGKTFTTVRFLCQEPLSDGYKVLWLAHTHHLLDQAIDAFGPADPQSTAAFEVAHIAEPHAELAVRVVSATTGHFPVSKIAVEDNVVIATLQTVCTAWNNGHPSLDAFLRSCEGKLFVVFDEAHHAPAPSYRKLLERLRTAYPAMYLLGLTATPTYTDEQRQGWLKALFPQDVLATVSRAQLIAAGVLAKPHFEDARTGLPVDLEEGDCQRWQSSFGDLPENIVTSLARNRERNDFIAETYIASRETYGKTLIFADRWYQCDYLREALLKRGVKADVVYSHVDARLSTADARNRRTKDENALVLERFRNDELDVLINVRMLTEGTDVPSVKTAFLTRQTTSNILLTQMIGRALRGPAFGGTADAYIVSFIDSWNRVISFADYHTLPEGMVDGSSAEHGRKPPLQMISIELVRKLSRTMYEGGAAPVAFQTLLPIGWYRVEFENRAATADDIGWSQQLIMVFESEKDGYDACMRELAASDWMQFAGEVLTLDECAPVLMRLRDRYFSTSTDHPGTDVLVDLFQIARHIGQHDGELPSFFDFAERAEHDLDAIALELANKDPKLSELDEYLRVEYCKPNRFWQALYPSYDLFYAQFQASMRRLRDLTDYGSGPGPENVVRMTQSLPDREPSDAVKAAVIRRDRQRCCCCGATDRLEVDHIIAKSLGGGHHIEQLQTLCSTCNQHKKIAEMNFRTTYCLLNRPPELHELPLRAERYAASDSWLADVQRCINFYYRCSAVETLEVVDVGSEQKAEVRLWPGIDETWIAPWLEQVRAGINARRQVDGLGDIPTLTIVSAV